MACLLPNNSINTRTEEHVPWVASRALAFRRSNVEGRDSVRWSRGIQYFRNYSTVLQPVFLLTFLDHALHYILCTYHRILQGTCDFIRNEEYSLEAARDDLLHHLASVRYQRNTPVVAALCTILLPVGYHDNGISPHIRHPLPLQMQRRYGAVSIARRDHR